MMHQNSLNNLVSWEKGVGGNPSGRPKGTGLYALTCKYSQLTIKEVKEIKEDENSTATMVMACNHVLRGCNGQYDVLKDTIDREEGKAIQTQVNIDTQGVQPITDAVVAQRIIDVVQASDAESVKLLENMNVDVRSDDE